MPKKKIPNMTRINTRIRVDHKEWIQKEGKKLNLTQGEVFRRILDKHIKIKK